MLTHDDLDAAGCAICGTLAFKNDINIEFHNHDSLNMRWETFLDENCDDNYTQYDLILISDICPEGDWIFKINGYPDHIRSKFMVLDHHLKSLPLKDCDWTNIVIKYDEDTIACGTSLTYDYLLNNYNLVSFNDLDLKKFVELIRLYDTWQWFDQNNLEAKKLCRVFITYGMKSFVQKYLDYFKCDSTEFFKLGLFDDFDDRIFEIAETDLNNYIEKKSKQIFEREIHGYKAAVLFCELNHSELGNHIARNNPQYDIVVMINAGVSVSFRCCKENIDLNELAEKFGGGGHAKASGCPITTEMKEHFIDDILLR